jgi:RimJ/RimL family protein N-acetyltransferase
MGACAVALRRTRGIAVDVLGVARTDLRTGEPVFAAACRAASQGVGIPLQPWAVDLSGEPAWFAVDVPDTVDVAATVDLARTADVPRAVAEPRAADRSLPVVVTDRHPAVPSGARAPDVLIGFRPLTRADFPNVVTWQRQPHVSRWWQDEAVDVAAAENHYGPALDGTDPTRLWVVELNGRSVGLLQDYAISDHPDWALLTARPGAIGLDYLVGDPSWVGRGVGTRMLWHFLRDVIRPHYPQATEYFAAPDHRNGASLRVLDKLGFTRGLWFDEPQPDGRVDTVVGCTFDVLRILGPTTATTG